MLDPLVADDALAVALDAPPAPVVSPEELQAVVAQTNALAANKSWARLMRSVFLRSAVVFKVMNELRLGWVGMRPVRIEPTCGEAWGATSGAGA